MTEKKAESPAGEAVNTAAADYLSLIGVGWNRIEQLDGISRAVFDRIQAERQKDVEFGVALLKCKSPADAFVLYTRWLSERTSTLMQDGSKIAELWTQLYAPSKVDKAPQA